jgi:hypothetical protein
VPDLDFTTAVDRLLHQVGHWEQPRWSADSRSERVFELVQRLADLAADAEGRGRRPVPRAGDLLLPDQLRVMRDDLVAASPGDDVLKLATEDVDALRRAL